jgi:hypothetical protein
MATRSNGNGIQHTVTSLNRWSVANKQLPGERQPLLRKFSDLHKYSCGQNQGVARLRF